MATNADVIVIGSGSAGLTAALYLRRAQVDTVVIEGDPFDPYNMPGGQLMLTKSVDFIPGLREVFGPDLMGVMRDQAEGEGVEFVSGEVTSAALSTTARALTVDDTEYTGRSVVVATGARPRMLGLEHEDELVGYGVSVCAMCDGPLFKGKSVVVVGGGDTAFEEALELSEDASSVTIVHRGSTAGATAALQARVAGNPGITIRLGTTVTGYEVSDRLEGIRFDGTEGSGVLAAAGVFLAIGRVPNTEVFRRSLATDDDGYIMTTDGAATSVRGVFACGECQDRRYRQFATAVGSGCMAGIDAARWLLL